MVTETTGYRLFLEKWESKVPWNKSHHVTTGLNVINCAESKNMQILNEVAAKATLYWAMCRRVHFFLAPQPLPSPTGRKPHHPRLPPRPSSPSSCVQFSKVTKIKLNYLYWGRAWTKVSLLPQRNLKHSIVLQWSKRKENAPTLVHTFGTYRVIQIAVHMYEHMSRAPPRARAHKNFWITSHF